MTVMPNVPTAAPKKLPGIKSRTIVIPLSRVRRDPRQPRQTFHQETIEELAASIRAAGGVMHAMYVREDPDEAGYYILISGERRTRALNLLGIEEHAYELVDETCEIPPYVLSLIENQGREDLNPIDQAEAFERALTEYKISMADLVMYTGQTEFFIQGRRRLLKRPKEVQDLIRQGKIKLGMAALMAQYRNQAAEIRIAQKILAGEEVPELDEARTTEVHTGRILGHMPKSADGMLLRLMHFMTGAKSPVLVMQAFLDLGEDLQIEGWNKFTGAHRQQFEERLKGLYEALGRLIERQAELPPTNRPLSGSAAITMAAVEAGRPNPFLPPPRPRRDTVSPATATETTSHHEPAETTNEVEVRDEAEAITVPETPHHEPAPLPNLEKAGSTLHLEGGVGDAPPSFRPRLDDFRLDNRPAGSVATLIRPTLSPAENPAAPTAQPRKRAKKLSTLQLMRQGSPPDTEFFTSLRGGPSWPEEITSEDMLVADKFMDVIRTHPVGSLLSLAKLGPTLGNGQPATEDMVLRAVRAMGVVWRCELARGSDREVLRFAKRVADFREAINDPLFPSFHDYLRRTDESSDPVRLSML